MLCLETKIKNSSLFPLEFLLQPKATKQHLSLLKCHSDKNAQNCTPPPKSKLNIISSKKLFPISSAKLLSHITVAPQYLVCMCTWKSIKHCPQLYFIYPVSVFSTLWPSLVHQSEIPNSTSSTKPKAVFCIVFALRQCSAG